MVRKPKVVWPGLAKVGMWQKQIAGDGNCLFASLSDQLYGDPTKHPEIRQNVIEHMRSLRPIFEHYVHKDDVQQRRTTRSAANAMSHESDDAFEEYLTLMSRPGAYGGEPELVAFCQVYDQDVTVHLPKIRNFDQDSIFYTNEHRDSEVPLTSLHICYGGDEVTRAHYDSARNRDGSHPRSTQSPRLEPQDSRRNSGVPSEQSSLSGTPSARALRNSRPDLSNELFQDILQKGKKELEAGFETLNHRARSSSVSSSHRSSSSKRSLDDEGDHPRRKRADRRKSTRKRTDMSTVSYEDADGNFLVESPTDNTPASTQETELSSDAADKEVSDSEDGDYRPVDGDVSDSELKRTTKRKMIKPSSRATILNKTTTQSSHPIKIAERPRPVVRT